MLDIYLRQKTLTSTFKSLVSLFGRKQNFLGKNMTFFRTNKSLLRLSYSNRYEVIFFNFKEGNKCYFNWPGWDVLLLDGSKSWSKPVDRIAPLHRLHRRLQQDHRSDLLQGPGRERPVLHLQRSPDRTHPWVGTARRHLPVVTSACLRTTRCRSLALWNKLYRFDLKFWHLLRSDCFWLLERLFKILFVLVWLWISYHSNFECRVVYLLDLWLLKVNVVKLTKC